MKKVVMFILVSLLFLACKQKDHLEEKIRQVKVEMRINRFDMDFSEATPGDLPRLKSAYPFLFHPQYEDSVWIGKMKDTIQQEISEEVLGVFPDFSEQAQKLRSLFQHIKYYFPEFREPEVITLTSEVDYTNRVIWADSLLLLSLDSFLGQDHRFYESIPEYQRKNLSAEYLVSDAAAAFISHRLPPNRERGFLAAMVHAGKELYLKDILVPGEKDAVKIGYTDEEMAWVAANESEIWRYFIERSLLFSTDSRLKDRFIEPAPFSKFYLELDNESPGGVGRYIGWRIVRAYMQNNDVSLQELLYVPAEEVFSRAGYKPER